MLTQIILTPRKERIGSASKGRPFVLRTRSEPSDEGGGSTILTLGGGFECRPGQQVQSWLHPDSSLVPSSVSFPKRERVARTVFERQNLSATEECRLR